MLCPDECVVECYYTFLNNLLVEGNLGESCSRFALFDANDSCTGGFCLLLAWTSSDEHKQLNDRTELAGDESLYPTLCLRLSADIVIYIYVYIYTELISNSA
jgi:hypothetical protein